MWHGHEFFAPLPLFQPTNDEEMRDRIPDTIPHFFLRNQPAISASKRDLAYKPHLPLQLRTLVHFFIFKIWIYIIMTQVLENYVCDHCFFCDDSTCGTNNQTKWLSGDKMSKCYKQTISLTEVGIDMPHASTYIFCSYA